MSDVIPLKGTGGKKSFKAFERGLTGWEEFKRSSCSEEEVEGKKREKVFQVKGKTSGKRVGRLKSFSESPLIRAVILNPNCAL